MKAQKAESKPDSFEAYSNALKEFDQAISEHSARLHDIKTGAGTHKPQLKNLKIKGLDFRPEIAAIERSYARKLSRVRRKSGTV